MTDHRPRNRTAPVAFRDQSVESELARRADARLSPGLVAARDLERYYDLLRRELDRVELSDAEWNLLRDVANGTLWEPASIPLLWAEVSDGIRHNDLAAKWDVDGAALVATLQALTPAQAVAVVDAVERWWRETGERSDVEARSAQMHNDDPATSQ